jgi:hypothetical protein
MTAAAIAPEARDARGEAVEHVELAQRGGDAEHGDRREHEPADEPQAGLDDRVEVAAGDVAGQRGGAAAEEAVGEEDEPDRHEQRAAALDEVVVALEEVLAHLGDPALHTVALHGARP